jgi:hypothetical protein
MRFRKEIFQQKTEDNTVYLFSKKDNGKSIPLTISELTEKVKVLVTHACTLPTNTVAENQVILGKRVRHLFQDGGRDVWYTGRVISQV